MEIPLCMLLKGRQLCTITTFDLKTFSVHFFPVKLTQQRREQKPLDSLLIRKDNFSELLGGRGETEASAQSCKFIAEPHGKYACHELNC